jgi:hypothetical protein
MTPEDEDRYIESRYMNDPTFHALVDTIYAAVERKQYTPGDVRDAAILASLMYEQRRVRDFYGRVNSWD